MTLQSEVPTKHHEGRSSTVTRSGPHCLFSTNPSTFQRTAHNLQGQERLVEQLVTVQSDKNEPKVNFNINYGVDFGKKNRMN